MVTERVEILADFTGRSGAMPVVLRGPSGDAVAGLGTCAYWVFGVDAFTVLRLTVFFDGFFLGAAGATKSSSIGSAALD